MLRLSPQPELTAMEITRATTITEFQVFRTLLDEMAAWDAIETRARGFDAEALLRLCYSDSAEDLQAEFTGPGAAMYLGRLADAVVGCAGFNAMEPGVAEVAKVFLRPGHRGLGLGASLVGHVMTEMRQSGYLRARIETAEFMTSAIAIYRQSGFEPCPPFRPPMGDLGPMTVFLECKL